LKFKISCNAYNSFRGASGLEAAREMLQQGLIPTIFEKNDLVGGVWRNDVGNVWTNMRTNLSRFNVSFSNHPWSKETHLFPTGTQVQEYLISFIDKFKLENYIKCKTNVTSVEQNKSDNHWRVTWIFDDVTYEEVFDFVVVAIGSFSNPKIPNYATELFKGQIVHSMDYNSLKNTTNLKNKKVLVVGHSFSATEICADLIEQQANVLNVFKSPHWIVKKFIKIPEKKVFCPIDFELVNRKLMNNEEKSIRKNSFFSSICPSQNKIKELFINPCSSNPPLIAISDTYLELVEQNKIRLKKGYIQDFNAHGVTFNDGSYEDADIVLFSTGYRLDLNFLDKNVLETIKYDSNDDLYPLILYKGN
jgi:dimethylaniline monooxygenase (N-oxide forming)